jgi:hypothetical protein
MYMSRKESLLDVYVWGKFNHVVLISLGLLTLCFRALMQVLKLQLHPAFGFKLWFDEVSLYKHDSVLHPIPMFTLIDLLLTYFTLLQYLLIACLMLWIVKPHSFVNFTRIIQHLTSSDHQTTFPGTGNCHVFCTYLLTWSKFKSSYKFV